MWVIGMFSRILQAWQTLSGTLSNSMEREGTYEELDQHDTAAVLGLACATCVIFRLFRYAIETEAGN
jgi:hypothetical protein